MPSHHRAILPVLLALLLGVSGLLLASNMGLMKRATFTATGVDYWVALPYRSDLSTANDLCQLIGSGLGSVSYFDSSTGDRIEWWCPFGNNFPLTAGQGLFLSFNAPASAVFLGSHDAGLAIPQGGFTQIDRPYYLALPYHSTAAVAQDVCREIPNAKQISRFDAANGTTEDWTCPNGINFTIRPGEALRVQVGSPGPSFVPSHY